MKRNIKYIYTSAGLFFVAIVMISFIYTPMTADVKVFMACANQANYISKNLLAGSYKVWELKGVFSRMLMYAIYKIAVFFVPFSSYFFEVLCNFIYAIIIVLIVAGSNLFIFYGVEKKKIFLIDMFVAGSIMATHTGCHLQVEMTATLLMLMAAALYINAITNKKGSYIKLFLSGIFIGAMFFFKSVLILLSISVVAAVSLWNIKKGNDLSLKRVLVVVAGSITMLILNLSFIVLINPNEIQDMIDASAFQRTLFSVDVSIPYTILQFGYYFVVRVRLIPIVLLGLVALVCNLLKDIKGKRWIQIFFHIIMWLMPVLFVVLSNNFFLYHFFVFVFPGFVEIYFWVGQEKGKVEKFLSSMITVGGVVVYLIYMSIFSVNVKTYIKYDCQTYKERDLVLEQIGYDKSEEIMYLDDGVGAYYLGNRSYLRYFFPLPLQRLDNDSKLECYRISMENALAYNGKYISVYEKWFFANKNLSIKEKINSEYKKVGGYERFAPPHSLSSSDITVQYFDLYERIDE